MALWWVKGQVVDDQQEGVSIPEDATRVDMFRNPAQYGEDAFAWDPQNRHFSGNIQQTAPGYLSELLARGERRGQLKPYELEDLQNWEATARAMPTRDIGSLTAGWQGDPGSQDWWSRLDPGSPDAGAIMLQLREKMDQGQATPQERQLYQQTRDLGADWDFRASTPQESDANAFGLGNNLFDALFVLGLGATGGLAGGALAAGGAGLGSTLGSLGTLAGTAGQVGGLIGQATDQDWLADLGKYLGAAGSIAGGVGGLTNVFGTGVQGLGDVARLASSAGRITGGLGTLADSDVLRQAGGYLGAAGQVGGGVNTLADVFGGGVSDLTDAARLASGAGQVASGLGRLTGFGPLSQAGNLLGMGSRLGRGVQGLLGKAGQAQRRGTEPQGQLPPMERTMTNEDWLRWQAQPGPWQENATPVLWNL